MRPSGRLLSALLASLLVPAAAHAFDGGAWTVSPGEWYSEVSATRFSSNSRFFPDGRNGAIASLGRYQELAATSYNEIGWRKSTSLMVGVPFTSRKFRSATQDGDTMSVSGISDLVIGLRVRLKEAKPALVADGGWIAPAGYNKYLSPSLGDGRQKFFGALHAGLQLPWIRSYVQGSRGLLFISEDGELYWRTRVEAAGWVRPKVMLGLRYSDRVPLSTVTEIGREPHVYRAGGWATVRIDDRMDLSIGADRRFFGRNSLEGTHYQVVLGFKQTKLNALQGHLGASP